MPQQDCLGRRMGLDAAELAGGSDTQRDAVDTVALELQAKDNAGNWSAGGSFTIVIDLTAPAAPVVTGSSPVVGSSYNR